MKEKYDFLKDNVDFEYMLEYDDSFLVDKILELKELCTNADLKYIVDNYKILDEYKYLYLKIDKLEDTTIKYENYKNDKFNELKQRDIDFDKLKSSVYNLDRDKEYYERFVSEQELLFKSLEEKILNIDKHEHVTYKLKGFNKLLGNSFKYLGLLFLKITARPLLSAVRATREKFLFASETDTIILVSSCIKNTFLCYYYIPKQQKVNL